jgi:hypothetical protein
MRTVALPEQMKKSHGMNQGGGIRGGAGGA